MYVQGSFLQNTVLNADNRPIPIYRPQQHQNVLVPANPYLTTGMLIADTIKLRNSNKSELGKFYVKNQIL
jgi:hypothetical protein